MLICIAWGNGHIYVSYYYQILQGGNEYVWRKFKSNAKSKRIYTGGTCNKAECCKRNSEQSRIGVIKKFGKAWGLRY